MIKLKCNECLGEYFDTCTDGLAYYHACAMLLDADDKPIARPNRRNENIGTKTEGRGVTRIQ